MPITQNRMIALIQAAEDFYETGKAVADTVREIRGQVELGNLTAQEGLRQAFQVSLALQPRPESLMGLAAERAHFKVHQHENIANAERMARLREARGAGMPVPDGRLRQAVVAAIRGQVLAQGQGWEGLPQGQGHVSNTPLLLEENLPTPPRLPSDEELARLMARIMAEEGKARLQEALHPKATVETWLPQGQGSGPPSGQGLPSVQTVELEGHIITIEGDSDPLDAILAGKELF